MDWNPIAIGVGILVLIFAILGVIKVSKKREVAEEKAEEEKAEEEHQQDLTDLPKTDSHSYHYSAEEAYRKGKEETSSQVLVPGINAPVNNVFVAAASPQEVAENPLPETTPVPIEKPNKPIRKHRKKH
jgi:uncharacterized protein YpmB